MGRGRRQLPVDVVVVVFFVVVFGGRVRGEAAFLFEIVKFVFIKSIFYPPDNDVGRVLLLRDFDLFGGFAVGVLNECKLLLERSL